MANELFFSPANAFRTQVRRCLRSICLYYSFRQTSHNWKTNGGDFVQSAAARVPGVLPRLEAEVEDINMDWNEAFD